MAPTLERLAIVLNVLTNSRVDLKYLQLATDGDLAGLRSRLL